MTTKAATPTDKSAQHRKVAFAIRPFLTRTLAAFVAASPLVTIAETNEPIRETLRMTLVMQNGDHVSGESGLGTFAVRSPVGRLPIPTAQVMTATLNDDQETFSFVLANGDLLTGVPEFASVEMSGPAGKLAIDIRHIRVIRVDDVNVPVLGRNRTVALGGTNLALRPVPAGTFVMGSEEGRDDERPVRTVRISHGFWMGRHEVTQAEWQSLMGSRPYDFLGDHYPVRKVSWNQCMDFCRILTANERKAGRLPPGYIYRLPTEAEWEFAARADTRIAGPAPGSNDLAEVAWHMELGQDRPHPVEGKRPNDLGLYDMRGNVWEWCMDWYQDSYNELGDTDPKGPKSGWFRVCRGGSWRNDAFFVRPACRSKYRPVATEDGVGFRVVLAAPM